MNPSNHSPTREVMQKLVVTCFYSLTSIVMKEIYEILGNKNKTKVEKRDQSLYVGPKPKGLSPLKTNSDVVE